MRTLRQILLLALVSGLLGAGLVVAVWRAWRVDPLRVAARIVARDELVLPGSVITIRALVLPMHPSAADETATRVVYAQAGHGQWTLITGEAARTIYVRHPPIPDARLQPHLVPLRLDAESGLGRPRTSARVFVLNPNEAVVAVDLEPLRADGRYHLLPASRDWLSVQLAGRRPVYLADATLSELPQLVAAIEQAGWPVGPVVLWRRNAADKPVEPKRALGALAGFDVQLAILGPDADNEAAIRPIRRTVTVVRWPGS